MKNGNGLSVIVPVYNWDITLLVEALAREVVNRNLRDEVEIIIADDCSNQEYKDKNVKAISAYSFCRYYEQEERLGRKAGKVRDKKFSHQADDVQFCSHA